MLQQKISIQELKQLAKIADKVLRINGMLADSIVTSPNVWTHEEVEFLFSCD